MDKPKDSKDSQAYTPETLRDYEHKMDDMHADMLCIDDERSSRDPESEQFFLLALESLSMARRYLTIAAMRQSRAISCN